MTTTSEICADIGKRLEGLFPKERPWPLHEPEFGILDEEYVVDCVRSGWVSSVGSYVDRFEEEMARLVGAKHAVAVVNGTSALHLALVAIGVEPESEVLVPSLTFIATANAVRMAGAVPHFIDSEPDSLGIDIDKLGAYLRNGDFFQRDGEVLLNRRTGRRISAIVPVHTLGHPVNMTDLLPLSEEFHLPIIEDAAESLGSCHRGRHTGTFGKIGCFSFNGNKILTTGGGGVLVTDQTEMAKRIKHLSTTAKVPHRWEFIHDEAGYNYRLPNINAALGVAQLSVLQERIERKQKIAMIYEDAFDDFGHGRIHRNSPGNESNAWLNALILDDGETRDEVLGFLSDSGVFARPFWGLLHLQAPYFSCPHMENLSGAERLFNQTICLPSSSTLVS